jgi:hypothetical protein
MKDASEMTTASEKQASILSDDAGDVGTIVAWRILSSIAQAILPLWI